MKKAVAKSANARLRKAPEVDAKGAEETSTFTTQRPTEVSIQCYVPCVFLIIAALPCHMNFRGRLTLKQSIEVLPLQLFSLFSLFSRSIFSLICEERRLCPCMSG